MDSKNIKKSSKRILLHAEAFGFGPSAAIAVFFQYLQCYFTNISYIGQAHTLNLQQGLGYKHIYNMDILSPQEIKIIVKDYDIFLTAMDINFIKTMKDYGLKTCFYDALTRYRPTPLDTQNIDLYIAQDFFNVGKKFIQLPKDLRKHIVSPIIQSPIKASKKENILINLGGLHNPFRDTNDIISYINPILTSIVNYFNCNEKIIITGSKEISAKLPEFNIITPLKSDMEEILSSTKIAFMTSGLGNIYDVANYNIPTIRLPPSNDSQGQQLELLKKNNINVLCLDRGTITQKKEINYFNNQADVIKSICHYSKYLDSNILTNSIKNHVKIINQNKYGGSLDKIITLFGRGGAEQVAKEIYIFSKTI